MSQACMGGWCPRRDRCALHNQAQRVSVSERLCEPGEADAFQPLRQAAPRPKVMTLHRALRLNRNQGRAA